jgi:hypothetical protein
MSEWSKFLFRIKLFLKSVKETCLVSELIEHTVGEVEITIVSLNWEIWKSGIEISFVFLIKLN